MKRNLKFYIIFGFMLLIMSTTNVYAVSNMKVTEKSYIKTNFNDGTHRTEAYFNTNKGVAYCITPSKKGAPQGNTLTYSKTVDSGSVLYLLDKAGNSKSDYLTTQLAIWKINNNYLPEAYKKNSSLVSKVNKLANTAKNNSNYLPSPTMKLSNSSLSFTESSDGNYYISNTISITASDIDKIVVTVSSSNGAVVVSNQKSGTSLTISNKKFNIKVPKKNITANTTIKVTVKGTGNKLAYQRYSGGSWQDLIVLVKTPKTVSTTISGTIKPVVYKCQYTNGKYYDKDGNVTDKTTYSIQCEKHTCEKVGNTYYGKDGNVTDEDGYNQQCKAKTYTCEKVGNTYYGKDGNEVSEKDYNLQCKTHSCEQVDDKFFDKNGKEITENEFNLQCKTHICEKVNDKYFDKDGNETDEINYKNQCEMTIEVPNTGSSDSLVFTVLGALTLVGTVLVIKKL